MHDLEGYLESLAEQGLNNPFFRSDTKKWGLAPPSGALTFQVVSNEHPKYFAPLENSGYFMGDLALLGANHK